jgi:diadenosine tetraphosphatase ApaH/serine/threonine PP2A family protein phosphatase
MSGLATITYAPLSTVTNRVLSPTQPCVTRVGSALLIMRVNAWLRGLNVYAGVRPLPPAPAHFPTVHSPSFPPFYCYLVAIRTFVAVPACLSETFRHVFETCNRFLPPLHRGGCPGNRLPLHCSSMPIILCLFTRWRAIGSPRMFWRSICGAWRLEARPAVRGPAWEPRSPFFLLAAAEFLRLRTLFCLPPYVVLE